jgi:hypothetical protein
MYIYIYIYIYKHICIYEYQQTASPPMSPREKGDSTEKGDQYSGTYLRTYVIIVIYREWIS